MPAAHQNVNATPVRQRRAPRIFVGALLAGMLASIAPLTASASGEDPNCLQRRPLQDTEKTFFPAVKKALTAFPMPAGMRIYEDLTFTTDDPTPRDICAKPYGLSDAAFSYIGRQHYTRHSAETLSALQQKLAARQASVITAETKELEALTARVQSAKDPKVQEKLLAEIAKVSESSARAHAKISQMQADSFLETSIRVNSGDDRDASLCMGQPRKVVVPGATAAFICTLEVKDRDEPLAATQETATLLAVFGRTMGAPEVNANPTSVAQRHVRVALDIRRDTTPRHLIQAVTVEINAAPATLEEYMKAVDWAKVASIVNAPAAPATKSPAAGKR